MRVEMSPRADSDRLRIALEEFVALGHVFDTRRHLSCRDLCDAVLIALEALRAPDGGRRRP